MVDVTLTIAGQAGQGVDTAAELLSRAMARAGYHVFAYPDVMSRIRGGHNFTRVRVSDGPVYGPSRQHNALLTLDQAGVRIHGGEMVEAGVLVADGSGEGATRVPLADIAAKLGAAGTMGNVVGLGALLALTGHPLDTLAGLVRERFAAKGRKVVKLNLDCLRAGAEYVKKHRKGTCPCLLPVLGAAERRLVVSGSQALALGAIAGGVRFYAGYPMSPATPTMEFLSVHQKDMGLVVEQAEDEVSALNMVLGASYAGVRAMTATSGGGFSLMVEALGFAGMAELPCVVVIAQRPGPATGFPTRTEQADLLFSISASQDEFPRFVLAPGSAEEAFHCMRRAFGLAERYQVPVLVLTDQFLSDSVVTVAGLDAGLESETGAYEDERWAAMPGDTYRRYEVTADGVSPLVRPGTRGQFVRCIGAEHDEQGDQTEDANARTRMHEKRMTKLVAMACAADGVECIPSERVETLVTAWGSTAGPVREAVERLRARGANVGMLRLSTLAPFPRERVRALSSKARRLVTVERNSSGQLAALMGRELRMRPPEQVLRYDGRPFSGAELVERLGRLVG